LLVDGSQEEEEDFLSLCVSWVCAPLPPPYFAPSNLFSNPRGQPFWRSLDTKK
jgi:hypothetical protein